MNVRWRLRLFGLGCVLLILGFVLPGAYTCSDVGSHGERPGGFGFVGIEGGDIVWTPDGGVNTCRGSVLIPGTPAGGLLMFYAGLEPYVARAVPLSAED